MVTIIVFFNFYFLTYINFHHFIFLPENKMNSFGLDCPGYDVIPSYIPFSPRIIVIGDIHGDFAVSKQIFQKLNLIDNLNKWIAIPKNTVVVQVGDQLDRCRPNIFPCSNPVATEDDESDINVLDFFNLIHSQAIRHGGGVYSLLGNHEIMNVHGDMNYVSAEGLKTFEGYEDKDHPDKKFDDSLDARKYAFKPGSEYARLLACTRQTSIIVGSNLFVHAGILPSVVNDLKLQTREGFDRMNETIRKWLLGILDSSQVDKDMFSSKSPFWTRVFGNIAPNLQDTDPTCGNMLIPVLNGLRINNMIVGHTPQLSHGINSTCSSKLWRVDIGMSKAFDQYDFMKMQGLLSKQRSPHVLEIINDKEFNIVEV